MPSRSVQFKKGYVCFDSDTSGARIKLRKFEFTKQIKKYNGWLHSIRLTAEKDGDEYSFYAPIKYAYSYNGLYAAVICRLDEETGENIPTGELVLTAGDNDMPETNPTTYINLDLLKNNPNL